MWIKSHFFLVLPTLFIIFSNNIIASDSDTLVNISDLAFEIDEELQNFTFEDHSHYLDLLYFTDNYNVDLEQYQNFKSKLESTITELQAEIAKSKKPEKKIKLIYKSIHDEFLIKYQIQANFNEIISGGIYNCVTATALYALILDQLGIPYTIKETPRHVYLIAFPKNEQILMESTDPTQGYVFHTNEYKNTFVQNLRNSKLISEKEYKSQNVNALFEKYYYVDKDINLQQLISIHYSNNATAYLEKEEVREFHEQMKKASYLYPCPRNTFLLFTSTLLLLDGIDYKEDQEIEDFIFLSRFIDRGVSTQDILHEFTRITYEYLVNSSRPTELDKIYAELINTNTPTEFKEELAFYYNYEKGRYYLIKGQYNQAYPLVKKAFEIKPGNADAQSNMIANFSNFLMIDASSTLTLARMDSLVQQYPEVLENHNFIRVYGICQLKCIEEYFKNKNPEDGNKTLSDFELLTNNYATVRFEEDFIGRAYSEAAVYYFKKGQNKKSIEYLNRGRKLAPSSTELKSRLIMIQ